jgi:uncharacterized protein (DUF2062 family)
MNTSEPEPDGRESRMTSPSDVRSLFRRLLHLHESPHRTALAFAVGVFIAFSPTYGFHTAMVVFCTWAFGLNFIALFAGAFLNNPWTLVPILGVTLWTGALIMGDSARLPPLSWDDLSFAGIYQQVMPYAVPFFVGGLVLSIIGTLIAYPLAYFIICKYRHPHAATSVAPLPPSGDVG